ncbi:MAG: fumarate hydratase C-terminal domain-containing protein [Burkholderiales bacterium]|nr:fumarate hydratase C-terminal domain-containing protein [Burkholderiales bacterium]
MSIVVLDDGTRELRLPLTREEACSLAVGDPVALTGAVTMTIGLPTHRRMAALLERGEALPQDLGGGAFVHLSSYNRERPGGGFEALYLNPSTSTRYDDSMPAIIARSGVRVVGGKGGLGDAGVAALAAAGCVYVSFLGGGCTLLSRAIRSVVSVHWNEYISQFRLVTLDVERLGPAVVAIDAHGNSTYRNLREAARERLPGILDRLARARGAAGTTTKETS